eukprot:405789-Pleurochrysis_carterae.AAC.1
MHGIRASITIKEGDMRSASDNEFSALRYSRALLPRQRCCLYFAAAGHASKGFFKMLCASLATDL